MKIKNSRFKIIFTAFVFSYVLCTMYYVHAYALNLDKLKSSFLSGDYKSAILEGEKLLAGEAQSSHSDELYYILALSYLKDGNLLRASDIFEIILEEFKNSGLSEVAKLGLGDAYFLKGDFDLAEVHYKELIRNNPKTKHIAQVYYRLSQIEFKKSDKQQAQEYSAKLKNEFPLNPEFKLNRDLYSAVNSSSGFYYSVQVGCFSNSVNASNLAQKLIKEGYPAFIEETATFDGKASYRVRVGKLDSRSKAVELENKLFRKGYPTKIFP